MTADNTPRLVSWDTTLLLNEDDQVQGIAAIGADVTSRRAIEAQIHQAQKLEGIGRMAAGIGHDFNNLLTVIIGHTSKLVHETRESPPLQESLSAISAAAEQCAGLSQQLLAVGRQQRLQSSICSLNTIIVGAEAVLRELAGRKTELDLQLDCRLKSVNADPAQIQRVLANLAGNACSAMPSGGELRIVTANADLDEAAVSGMPGLKPGSYVQLTVADTGTGMSEDVQARIFDPYFTTKPAGKGTGLGLSTVYGIVGQSGGHISVQSRLGEGATFTILLPAVEP
jgi:signal transduction histidine kinase